MKKLVTTTALLFTLSPLAELSGSIGIESDYLFRGVSQGNGSAVQMGLHVDHNGWFGGIWASQVDIVDAKWEHNFYGGYSFEVSDKLSFHAGIVEYDYDAEWLKIGPDGMTGVEGTTEIFVGGSYKNATLDYYVDNNDSSLSYVECGYGIPLGIAGIDLELTLGKFHEGGSVVGLKGSKDFGQWQISFVPTENSEYSNLKENTSLGIHYNF